MKYIAYYRVSTKRQGESQLGLKAQKHAVERFISPKLIDKEFTEIETGTSKRYRPILNEAIELCKKTGATLIIAKLDRLARNVAFVSSLMDSKVKFKAVDMPEANELTIHIMSAIAQHEAKAISKRVKEGLAQSNKKLGTPANLTKKARLRGLESIRHKAKNNPHNKRALAFVRGLEYKKLKLREIAEALNSNGFATSKGKEFSTTQVIRIKNKISQIA
jgi:DNA invertase Pin-like site-specific DNA recombinase|tara:strand:- start:4148 stop:4804 length:657 start_codon:yes stop_codon:yes gene_type:complete